eukprot:14345097-Alexandrium_andersonii.AAC.1
MCIRDRRSGPLPWPWRRHDRGGRSAGLWPGAPRHPLGRTPAHPSAPPWGWDHGGLGFLLCSLSVYIGQGGHG